jgi:polyisoprenoid-binding protein YceI
VTAPIADLIQYAIDPARSRFTIRAFAAGLLSGFGHNPTLAVRDYSGEMRFAPDSPANGSLKLDVKANSLAVQDDVSDKDRSDIEQTMKADVLEVQRFPEILFESKKVSGVQLGESLFAMKIEGDLTLHGLTRRQTFNAQVVPADGTLRAYGEGSLRQTDFGIRLVSVAGGALKVKDELKLSFDFMARQQG